jgi:hypothetical protein
MAGLPFTQLPAGEVTPEEDIERQIETGRKNIQQKYALQWQTVNNNASILGARKHRDMLMQIDSNAKAEMLDFNQRAEERLELKASRIYGRETAEAMYPDEKSVPQVFGMLDVHSNRIQGRLSEFRMTKERVPSLLLTRGREGVKPGKIQVWDRSIMVEDKKKKEFTMGDWRDATPEEIEERKLLVQELDRTKKAKAAILGQPDVSKRLVQPGTRGGTFGDKIAQSYDKPKQMDDPLGLFN